MAKKLERILLACCQGASTSLVVKKMQNAAEEQGKKYEIKAMPMELAREEAPGWDVILIGPQVKFEKPSLVKAFPDKPIDVIPPQLYGTANGPGVIKLAEDLYEAKVNG